MEISLTEMRDKISLCVIDHDLPALTKVRDALVYEGKVMDKWFDKYLDMFEKTMKPEQPKTKVWNLYHSKSEEYSKLQNLIRTADVYVAKLKH